MTGEDAVERKLGLAAAALARLEGRRGALAARSEELTRAIELAKGRLAVKDEVEAFIEAVHGSASRRNLEAFETLLSALVQEVLPGEKPVALDLSTERGLAALDICVRRPDGSLEDVLEDNGGALTNVVGMALRLIAVVKADVARFLALDEADCWIAPDRVAAFYRVLEDGARRLGVQCLAVSHHDLTQFSERFHIARIEGEPLSGVTVQSADCSGLWDDAAPGLRFIRLVNVQACADATLRLSPGVNALIGPNNRGKSTFIRALRAVFYGEARDSLVRAGAKTATVEIGVAGHRTLRFTRQPRRTPVNVWSLHEPDGGVVETEGMRYETGGRTVPDWVAALFRIRKVEDLDVHIAHQKFPVFLLGEPASRRSAVLSIGQEASYIRDMLAIHRERCSRDNALVRNGERELAALREEMESLAGLDGIGRSLAEARAKAERIDLARRRVQALRDALARLEDLACRLRRARARAAATDLLPDPARVATLSADLRREKERSRVARDVIDAAGRLRRAEARLSCLRSLPEALPALEDPRPAQDMLKRLADLRSGSERARERLARVDAEAELLRVEMERLVEENGGLCPTCGAPVSAETLLNHQAHSATERMTA
ncbi:AAA family ATPase [Microvirga thermotolerans]|uniref:AAA family ATPase n=1 Tax=Microvirga thermotolerans TaxID=2651334 RepID=A0A5P9K010_9HYPH|nr:AAA family ATPase [Microvirga thermotolerans]QFU15534.1 AAA family ATPase [Microvirga thermotolerans]